MDIEAIYDGIVQGTADPGDLSWTRRKLQLAALEHAKSGSRDQRLGALRVAAVLGTRDGLPIAQQLVRDSDREVRTWAFNQAVAARELGLPAIRDAVDGTDPALALAALGLLEQWVDATAVPCARRSLGASDAQVRAAGAQLLGLIGGPSVRVELQRLDHDPDPVVRARATEALRRIVESTPRPERRAWWDDTPAVMPTPPPGGAGPAPLAPQRPARDDARADEPDEARGAASPASTAPAPARQLPAPAHPPAVPPAVSDGAALPSPLPTETRALTRLLGMVGASDRHVVIEALRAADAVELGRLVADWRAGSDAALARGLCLAAGALARPAALSQVRQIARDPDPSVRACAAEAIGTLGGLSTVPALTALLADTEVGVAVAAVDALLALTRRHGRPDLARDALARVSTSAPALLAAVAAARQRL